MEHAAVPSVCFVLLCDAHMIENERARCHLQAIDAKVKDPKAQNAQDLHDISSMFAARRIPITESDADSIQHKQR